MKLVLAIVIVFVVLFMGRKLLRKRGVNNESESYDEELADFEEPDESMWASSHNRGHFKLRGLNFRDVTKGIIQGYIVACLNNPHDPKAIMVIDRDGKHLGYLPKGNGFLHADLLEKHHRYIPANIEINEDEDDDGRTFFHGYVDINLDLFPDLDENKFVSGF